MARFTFHVFIFLPGKQSTYTCYTCSSCLLQRGKHTCPRQVMRARGFLPMHSSDKQKGGRGNFFSLRSSIYPPKQPHRTPNELSLPLVFEKKGDFVTTVQWTLSPSFCLLSLFAHSVILLFLKWISLLDLY